MNGRVSPSYREGTFQASLVNESHRTNLRSASNTIKRPQTPTYSSGNYILPPHCSLGDPLTRLMNARQDHLSTSLKIDPQESTLHYLTERGHDDPYVENLWHRLDEIKATHASDCQDGLKGPRSRCKSAGHGRYSSHHCTITKVNPPQDRSSQRTPSPAPSSKIWTQRFFSTNPSETLSERFLQSKSQSMYGQPSVMVLLEKEDISKIPLYPSPTIKFDAERWMTRRNLGTGNELTPEIHEIVLDCFRRLNCPKDGKLIAQDTILIIEALGLERYTRDIETILAHMYHDEHISYTNVFDGLSYDTLMEILRRLSKAKGSEVSRSILSSEGRRLELAFLSQNLQRRQMVESVVRKYNRSHFK
eukprot:TRINITY_DN8511_c0_g1_i1.p1 TRINITY_DN8511_c0_g1~~TRINITY_DN8511_c0_g1_i1.p1  ORF type:complete len:361 (-),score=49.20 TRINITY_DN8511_c0_g1_i1:227-1309(-)